MKGILDSLKTDPISLVALVSCQPEVLAGGMDSKISEGIVWLTDPTKGIHRALDLGKTQWATFFRPMVLKGYFRSLFHGFRPHKAAEGEDLLQLGGDFLWDWQGKMFWSHRSKHPTDRPTKAEIQKVLGNRLLWGPA